MTWTWIGPFLLLLGPLVVIHELGHFIVAKLFGVKCERFSIGFGPPLLRYTIGETEYVLAALPLGGYVKMLGETQDEELVEADRGRSFYGQSPLKRTLIALAGPAMNMVLAIFVIAGMLMTIGLPTLTSKIGSVQANGAAARAEIKGGDRVVAVDGTPIWRWDELRERISEGGGKRLELTLERDGVRRVAVVEPVLDPASGEGRIGIDQGMPMPLLVLPDPQSPGVVAGLRSGDQVTSVAGKPIVDGYELETALAQASGPLALEVGRPTGSELQTVRVTVDDGQPGAWSTARLGAVAVDFAIVEAPPGTPANLAGLKPGDIFVEVNGQPVRSNADIQAAARASEGGPISLTVLRAGERVTVELRPLRVPSPDANAEAEWVVGAFTGPLRQNGETIQEYEDNVLVALRLGAVRSWDIVAQIGSFLGKLLMLRPGTTDSLTGPIGIGQIAVAAFRADGWFYFLHTMALISVNLALVNLLPIPLLDGGHIMFAAAEVVSGGPLGRRSREVAQVMGLSLILLLMGFALWNDLARNWGSIADFFTKLL